MARPKIDKVREERIEMQIVVDACNESERFGGWYCYLEDRLQFPFRARCIAGRSTSPLKKGEEVKVIGIADDDCDMPAEIFVQIEWQERELAVPLAQLEGIEISNETAEAIADWHYWRAHGYWF